MAELLGIDNLLPELIIGLGLALVLGNGAAWWKNRKGETPKGVPDARFRPGRALFLMMIGLLISTWGLVTLLG